MIGLLALGRWEVNKMALRCIECNGKLEIKAPEICQGTFGNVVRQMTVCTECGLEDEIEDVTQICPHCDSWIGGTNEV
jgi:uncharacterized protein with PIN domain